VAVILQPQFFGHAPTRHIICQHEIPMLDDIEHHVHDLTGNQVSNPIRRQGRQALGLAPCSAPDPRKMCSKMNRVRAGVFSKNIFDYRGNKFQMISKTTISSMARTPAYQEPPFRHFGLLLCAKCTTVCGTSGGMPRAGPEL